MFEEVSKICLFTDLADRKKTFVDVVELLKAPLTSSDLKKHIGGLNVLCRVLKLLPKDFLSSTELEFIAQFFCDQVKQHHSFITAAVNTMLTLVRKFFYVLHIMCGKLYIM